jgi:hypothetical protein
VKALLGTHIPYYPDVIGRRRYSAIIGFLFNVLGWIPDEKMSALGASSIPAVACKWPEQGKGMAAAD